MTNDVENKLRNSLESESSAIMNIDISHERIHDGNAFAFLCEKTTLATSGTCWITIKTNSEKNIHFRPAMLFSTASLVVAKLYEAPTITAETGTLVTVYNHSRPLATEKTSDVVVRLEPTILTNGTRLPLTVFAGTEGSQQSKAGGMGSADDEWILKADTLYGVLVQNIGSTATNVTIAPFWYEVTY